MLSVSEYCNMIEERLTETGKKALKQFCRMIYKRLIWLKDISYMITEAHFHDIGKLYFVESTNIYR